MIFIFIKNKFHAHTQTNARTLKDQYIGGEEKIFRGRRNFCKTKQYKPSELNETFYIYFVFSGKTPLYTIQIFIICKKIISNFEFDYLIVSHIISYYYIKTVSSLSLSFFFVSFER